MDQKICLITGATGDTGSKAARLLLDKGHKVKAFVHKVDERSAKLIKLGAEIVVGDLLDFKAVRGALEGVYGAYFVYPIAPGLIEATAFFAHAAKEAGVTHVVNMSQISARREANSDAAFNHWIAERILDWSGLSVTHLRPTFFAEWFCYGAAGIRKGLVTLGFTTGKHAPIAAEDQARVIASILENPGPHSGKTYPLFGPKEYTFPEAFAEIGHLLGREVRYQALPWDVWQERIANRKRNDSSVSASSFYNFTPFFAQHIVEVAKDHTAGVFSGTNDVVKQITGKEPMGLAEFVQQNKQLFEVDSSAAGGGH